MENVLHDRGKKTGCLVDAPAWGGRGYEVVETLEKREEGNVRRRYERQGV